MLNSWKRSLGCAKLRRRLTPEVCLTFLGAEYLLLKMKVARQYRKLFFTIYTTRSGGKLNRGCPNDQSSLCDDCTLSRLCEIFSFCQPPFVQSSVEKPPMTIMSASQCGPFVRAPIRSISRIFTIMCRLKKNCSLFGSFLRLY